MSASGGKQLFGPPANTKNHSQHIASSRLYHAAHLATSSTQEKHTTNSTGRWQSLLVASLFSSLRSHVELIEESERCQTACGSNTAAGCTRVADDLVPVSPTESVQIEQLFCKPERCTYIFAYRVYIYIYTEW